MRRLHRDKELYANVVSLGGTATFQGTGTPFTVRIILVLFDRVVDVIVVMQRQVPTFQGAETCGCSAGVVLCPRLFFLLGHGGGLRARGSLADLSPAPRHAPARRPSAR